MPAGVAQEMLGVVGQRGHARGGDVEQVAAEARAVGHAPADEVAALDQDDARFAGSQQVGGEQRAARTAADDRDGGTNLFRVY